MSDNDTRELLEQAFEDSDQASASKQSPELSNLESATEKETTVDTTQQVVDEFLEAPKSFKNEYRETFKGLDAEMRKYLHERERETEQGFSKLGNQVNDYNRMINNYSDFIKNQGFNSFPEWVDVMHRTTMALESDPLGAINQIANAYGINFNNNQQQAIQRDDEIVREVNNLKSYIHEQQQKEIQNTCRDFMQAKNEDGSLKYPYSSNVEVLDTLAFLYDSGRADSLESAYNMAVNMVPSVRDDIFNKRLEKEISKKAQEAQKANAASFSLKGKPIKEVEVEEDTRQELERKFAELEM